ncbi:CoA-transferase [Brevundimonas sp. GN22]
MADKRMTLDEIVDQLQDGMTIGIGGWATRRKPMALVRAIARSKLKDLTVVAYGGPDIGLLAANNKIKKLIFSFVSMDQIPLEPHFRAARQNGQFDVLELDEGLYQLGLRAAAMRVPFLPSRIGLGTDLVKQPELSKTVQSPFEDSETLLAMPAIHLDAALLHVHRSDERGNVLTLSPDPLFDELLARAAKKTFVTTEKLVSTAELDLRANSRFNIIERPLIAGVAEVELGAHPTSAEPDYHIDMGHLKTYVDASQPGAYREYHDRFVDVPHEVYVAAVGGPDVIRAQRKPVY